MKQRIVAVIASASASSLAALLFAGGLSAQIQKAEQKPSTIKNYSVSNHAHDLRKQPLELKGAKVATEAQARELAWQRYVALMMKPRGISATEGPRVVAIETVGFDISRYAKKGDAVWEVRVIDLVSGLNAIAWVHSESERVKFLLLPVPVVETEQ